MKRVFQQTVMAANARPPRTMKRDAMFHNNKGAAAEAGGAVGGDESARPAIDVVFDRIHSRVAGLRAPGPRPAADRSKAAAP